MNYNLTYNEKIKQAVGQVAPSTAQTLIRKIEGKRAEGYDDPTFDLILPFAREILQSAGSKVARDETVLRSFCIPFEDMLVDNGPSHMQSGRINRHSIRPVWNWLGLQMPEDRLEEISGHLIKAVSEEDLGSVRAICCVLYEEAADAIQNALIIAENNKKARRVLAAQFGISTGMADAAEMLYALKHARIIGEMRERLPDLIERVEARKLDALTQLFIEYMEHLPGKSGVTAASFMAHMKTPSHILRIAFRILGNRNGCVAETSEFATLGDILLFDIDRAVNHVVICLQRDMSAAEILEKLKIFHERIHEFTEEVEIMAKSRWGQRLAHSRMRISELLEREVKQAPGLLREYLRDNGNTSKKLALPAAAAANVIDAQPSEIKLVRTMQLRNGCKPFLDQLSINAAMSKVEIDLQRIVDYARMIGKTHVIDDIERMMQ